MAKTDIEMARNATTTTTAELIAIEDLAIKYQVPAWVMNGLKIKYNWGLGKQLTAEDFLAKKKAWLNGPMCSN